MFSTIMISLLLLITLALFFSGRASKSAAHRKVAENEQVRANTQGYSRPDPLEAQPFGSGRDVVGYLPAAVAVIPLALALIWAAFTMVTTIEAKQVGVLTTFGKPSERTLGPGLHLKAPWQKVTEVDATIQSDEYKGDGCITVKLGDGNNACVSTTNRWRVVQSEADVIYGDYRSNDPTESLRDAVVSTQFKAAVNAVFGGYDPTDALDAIEIDPKNPEASINALKDVDFAPDYDDLAQQVEDSMNERLSAKGDPLVDIEAISISYLRLDDRTQRKIDDFQAEIAKTRIALQSQLTATATARANEILSASLENNSEGILVSRCFDLIADGLLSLPAGGSCFPGGGGGVVIPSAGRE